MLEVGITKEQTIIVEEAMSAKNMGSGELSVYATPCMIALMENTAYTSVAPYLEPGQGTVGTKMDVSHVASTPIGMAVTCKSTLIEVDRRKLVFEVEAYDEKELIGKGVHERFIIQNEKFYTKTQQKITESGNPRKPQGSSGQQMLKRMNESHYPLTSWALDHLNILEEDAILDIGCGGGATLQRLHKQYPEASLYGVDHSEIAVQTAQELNPDLDIQQASVEKLPFEDNKFEKIITVESFYFWPKPMENVKEVARVLKSGGKFMIVAEIYGDNQLTGDAKINAEKFHLFNPTKKEFEHILHNAGLSCSIYTKDSWICVIGKKYED